MSVLYVTCSMVIQGKEVRVFAPWLRGGMDGRGRRVLDIYMDDRGNKRYLIENDNHWGFGLCLVPVSWHHWDFWIDKRWYQYTTVNEGDVSFDYHCSVCCDCVDAWGQCVKTTTRIMRLPNVVDNSVLALSYDECSVSTSWLDPLDLYVLCVGTALGTQRNRDVEIFN